MSKSNVEFVREIREALRANGSEVENSFGGLSAGALTWRPPDGGWSVALCLDHLRTTNQAYLTTITEAVELGRRKNRRVPDPDRAQVRGGRFGRWFTRQVGPDSSMKVKAPKVFRPIEDVDPGTVVGALISTHQGLEAILDGLGDLDLDRVRVSSPVSSLIRFHLCDAFRIVVAHERRHLDQARTVTGREGFPGG
jgi:hypothetical protein